MDNVVIVNGNINGCTLTLLEGLLNRGAGNDTAAASGPLFGAKLGLYKDLITPTPNLTLAELPVADYTGYAVSAAVVWNPAVEDSSDEPYLLGASKTFTPGDDVVPNTIRGVYCVNAAGTDLLWVANLANPVSIKAGEPLTIIPTFSLEPIA